MPRETLFVPPRFMPNNQLLTGAGSTAAVAINADLVDDDVRHAVHAFNHGHNL